MMCGRTFGILKGHSSDHPGSWAGNLVQVLEGVYSQLLGVARSIQ